MSKGGGWHGEPERHRQAAVKGLIKAGKRPSIFFEARSRYSKIVTFESAAAAGRAAAILAREYREAKTRAKRRRIIRVLNLAANRALASTMKTGMNATVKKRLRKVSDSYRRTASMLSRKFAKEYGGK